MPDTAQLDMGGQGGGGKGIPGWVMIAGAVAGIAGLALLLKGSGGGGTTAAGTSINAALGSIQEENMNLLGTTQAGFMQTSQQLSSGFGGVTQGLTDAEAANQARYGAISSQIDSVNTNLSHSLAALSSQMTGFSSDTQSQFASLHDLVASGQASQDQVNSATNSLLQSIQGDVRTGIATTNSGNAAINNLANFSFWQFYQLPNRYTPFINPVYTNPSNSATLGTY
jgi:hypothetical protein